MMRRWRVVAALAVVALAALVGLPFLLPLDLYRAPIESAASRATGRAVQIHGRIHLTLFSGLGISAENVSVANAPGARDANLAEIGDLIVGARLIPFLSGRLDVTELVLDHPLVHLEIAANGDPNWKLSGAKSAQRIAEPEAEAKATAISNFTLRKMRIDGGRVTYFNAGTGKSLSIEDVDMTVEMASAAAPLGLKGSLTYNGEKLNLDASAAHPARFVEDEGSAANGTVNSALFTSRFDGDFRIRGESTGNLQISGDSLRKLLTWTGYALGEGKTLGPFTLSTKFDDRNKRLELQNLKASLDGARLSCNLLLDRAEPVASVSGQAAIDGLNLDSYFVGDKKPQADSGKSGGNTPMNLAPLKVVNADVKFTLGRTVASEMTIDRAALALKLNDGMLTANADELSLYGGGGKMSLAIDARDEVPNFHHTLHLAGLQMLPFLKDLTGVNWIDGKGTLDLDVNSRGSTGRAVWSALAGKVSLELENGTIKGVDLLAISRLVQNLATAEILSVAGDKAETKFSAMRANFAVAGGVAHNKDFRLETPILLITGGGDIDLADRTLDVHLAPMATPALPIPDIGLPIHISGPWAHLRYGPDVKGLGTAIVRGLSKAPLDTLKNPGKTLKSLFGLGK